MSGGIGIMSAAALAGTAFGAPYLALLWIGARALAGPRPALFFAALAVLRAALVLGALAGALALGAGPAELIAALAGFIATRLVATRVISSPDGRVTWK